MSNREVKVTCRHCGSDQITHAARYIVRNPILKSHMIKMPSNEWRPDGWEELCHSEFGPDELLSNSCEDIDYPYDCKDCGEIEMVESDLLIDGKDHPDYESPLDQPLEVELTINTPEPKPEEFLP